LLFDILDCSVGMVFKFAIKNH